MTETPVETRALTKRYGERAVVDAVDLVVRPGEVFGFLGPNGAGKTTTMKMLLGLVRPSGGNARVLGAAPGDPEALRRIGMLVETPGFHPYLSGRDNLRALCRYTGVPDSRADAVLELVDLPGRDRYAGYSLGMKQRLGVAAALLKEPDLMILDEPTNGLDPAGAGDMRDLIRRLGETGRTVVLSSHVLADVQQLCERVAVISEGRLVREGTVSELRGVARLRVVVDDTDRARKIAEDLLGAERVDADGAGLDLAAGPDEAGRVNRELVTQGVEVSGLHPVERTLEEVFLELTGGAR